MLVEIFPESFRDLLFCFIEVVRRIVNLLSCKLGIQLVTSEHNIELREIIYT